MRQRAFTIIELALVGVLVFIVAALVTLTITGAHAKHRNETRLTDIDTLHTELERYYAKAGSYPSLANLNDAAWRAKNMSSLRNSALDDPAWHSNSACSKDGKPILSPASVSGCYSYKAASSDGSACDNSAKACLHYTVSANLDGGETYRKSSLAN